MINIFTLYSFAVILIFTILAFNWIILSAILAYYASSRGLSGFVWFLISIILSPIFGYLVYLVKVTTETYKITTSIKNTDKIAIGEKLVNRDIANDWICPKCAIKNSAGVYQCKECKYSLI
jgi:hypothetical protein